MAALSLWKKRRHVWADGQKSRKPNSPTGLSLHPLPPTDGELRAAERDVPRLSQQTPCGGQDGADSLRLLDVLDALRQTHVERLREQEGHQAAAHCYAAVRHLGQRPPHLIQQKHKWGQSPAEACHEGAVPHPVLPGNVGHRGDAEHREKEMGISFISDLGKKCRPSAPSLYFYISAEAFPPPPPPRFFLCQGFSRLFFLNFFVSSYNGNISQRATVAAVRNRFMSIMRKKLQFHTKNTCFKVVSALNV